ncbi:MAG: PAS domain-containing protein [Acidobacteriota bacterium]
MIGIFHGPWTMRVRIALGLALSATLMVGVMALAVGTYTTIVSRLQVVTEVDAVELRLVEEIQANVSQARMLARLAAYTDDPSVAHDAQAAAMAAAAACKRGLAFSDRIRPRLAAIGRALTVYAARLDRPPPDPGVGVADQALPGDLDAAGAELEADLHRLAERSWDRLEADREQVTSLTQTSLRNLVTLLVVGILLQIALMIWLPARIAAPLTRLRVMVRRIARGDEDRLLPADFPDDETRRLAEGLTAVLARTREADRLQRDRIRLLEVRSRHLLRQLDVPILVLDRDRRIVLASRGVETLVGDRAARVVGETAAAALGPAVDESLSAAVAAGDPQAIVATSLPDAEGAPRPFTLSVEVMRDQDLRTLQYLVVFRKPSGPPDRTAARR